MKLGLKMDAYLQEQNIKKAIKDVKTQLETEMLLQEELDRLEYKLYRHNLLYK